jgi:hypothetical protein
MDRNRYKKRNHHWLRSVSVPLGKCGDRAPQIRVVSTQHVISIPIEQIELHRLMYAGLDWLYQVVIFAC